MRRLFNEYEAFTQEGAELAYAVSKALSPILGAARKSGASMRDVEAIIHSEVNALAAEIVIKAALRKRKREREQVAQILDKSTT